MDKQGQKREEEKGNEEKQFYRILEKVLDLKPENLGLIHCFAFRTAISGKIFQNAEPQLMHDANMGW